MSWVRERWKKRQKTKQRKSLWKASKAKLSSLHFMIEGKERPGRRPRILRGLVKENGEEELDSEKT